ncbi:MAG: hypothetical protein AAF488_02245, partial [Planctomycetota bacterium]
RAWFQHRVEGELDLAGRAYRALVMDSSVNGDVRARAAIGLALVSEERGELDAARRWLARVRGFPGVSTRWQIAARREASRFRVASPETDPLTQLGREVEQLEQESERLVVSADAAEKEVERAQRLYDGLRDSIVGPALEEEDASPALELLESMAAELRETERRRRTVVSVRLERGLEFLAAGRYAQALNEAKRVLQIDPTHREATELLEQSRRLIATWTSVPPGSAEIQQRAQREVVRDMRVRLDEARLLYGAGRIAEAIATLDQVLGWYVHGPEPIADSEISDLIRPAEALMRRCLADTGSPAEAERLRQRSRELRRKLQSAAAALEEQTREIDATEEGVAVIRAVAPRASDQFVAAEIARLQGAARAADVAGRVSVAIPAYEDLLVWWSWFPELIAGDAATETARVRVRLAELRAEQRAAVESPSR